MSSRSPGERVLEGCCWCRRRSASEARREYTSGRYEERAIMPGLLGGREMWGMVGDPCVVDEWGFEKREMNG